MDDVIVFAEQDGRVFINPALGCASRCRFCYVNDLGFTALTMSPFDGDTVRRELTSSHRFLPGRNGTLISFSPDTEPFDRRVVAKTLEYVAAVSPLGNPLQIATRRKVERDIVKRIVDSLAYPEQLTLFVSSCTIRYHQALEPGTVTPAKRFETFAACRAEGLSACLYLKPVLPGVTIQDAEAYVEVIRQYAIQRCCVGVLYANAALLGQLNAALGAIGLPALDATPGDLALPFAGDLRQVGSIADALQLEAALAASGCRIHRTSSCVIAELLNVPSPQATWTRFPALCIHCQDCASLARSSPPPSWRVGAAS
jgi:DNA repair photolyase